jgi:hypothetical protein
MNSKINKMSNYKHTDATIEAAENTMFTKHPSQLTMAFLNGVEWAERWTPVEEGLPDEGVEVIVYDIVSESRMVAALNSDGYFFACTHIYLEVATEVTHWKPLPNPPQV